MFEIIPSEYVRNYYKKRGITFSDRERAMLICKRCDVPISARLEELEKIAADTDDVELKTDIKELIEHDHKQIEQFKNNDNKDYVYRNSLSGHFWDFDEALESEVSNGGFDTDILSAIKPKFGEEESFILKLGVGGTHAFSGETARFNEKGEMLALDGQKKILRKSEDITRCKQLGCPFKRGDIVMNCVTREIGVVQDAVPRRTRRNDFDFCIDYIDVLFLQNPFVPTSTPVVCKSCLPIMFEKHEGPCGSNFIREMSRMLRGNGYLPYLFDYYDIERKPRRDYRVFAPMDNPIKTGIGNGNTLIDIDVDGKHQEITLDMLKGIWSDIADRNRADIEYMDAEVIGVFVVFCVTFSKDRGSMVFVWDTDKQEFVRYYKATFAVKATVRKNMLYILDIVSNGQIALGYCYLGSDHDENYTPPPPEFDFDISNCRSISPARYRIDFEGDTPVIRLHSAWVEYRN